MADTKRTDAQGGELFYIDKDGTRQDASLHAEILGDDRMPWDLDLDKFSRMTPAEQEAYLKSLDDAMLGTGAPFSARRLREW